MSNFAKHAGAWLLALWIAAWILVFLNIDPWTIIPGIFPFMIGLGALIKLSLRLGYERFHNSGQPA